MSDTPDDDGDTEKEPNEAAGGDGADRDETPHGGAGGDEPPTEGTDADDAQGDGVDPEEALEGLDVDVEAEDLPEDPFTEMDVADIDEEAVWAELSEGAEPTVGEAPDEVVVPKRRYCERCEHFSPPPETVCNHEGTEILELVDMEHFRVTNCPVVAERRQIGATDIIEEEQ